MSLVPLRQVQAHSRLTALIALGLEQLIDLVSGILLLGRQMRIFSQQFVRSCPKGTEHR